MSLSYNCPDRQSFVFLSCPLTTTVHSWPPLLYLLRILPPTVSPPRRCTFATLFTLLLLQIHGRSCGSVRDAITQSASFEKERPMNPLSPLETKENGEVQVAFSNEDSSRLSGRREANQFSNGNMFWPNRHTWNEDCYIYHRLILFFKRNL